MFCYSKQSLVMMTIKVPPPLTWHICQIVIDCSFFVVTTCILNQFEGHWLLSDAFHFAISMSLKLREETENAPSFQTLMEEDLGVTFGLICLASNIKKEVCGVLNSFVSFLKKFDERKTYNMLALMLDLRFKNLCLVSSFIGSDQGITIVGNVI
jgi:hypothetical protein